MDVNSDLKKLLVASLGEDMQERVQFLTEDKNRLASEIAFYTHKLQKDLGHIDELSIEVGKRSSVEVIIFDCTEFCRIQQTMNS